MKKTLFILAVILLAACGKETEPKVGLEADIIGKWKAEQTFINDKWLDISSTVLYAEFTKDGKYIWNIDDYSPSTGTYKVSGKNVICTVLGQTHTYEVISISGSNAEVKIYMDGDLFHYKVKKLY